jgi:hypothetical protein
MSQAAATLDGPKQPVILERPLERGYCCGSQLSGRHRTFPTTPLEWVAVLCGAVINSNGILSYVEVCTNPPGASGTGRCLNWWTAGTRDYITYFDNVSITGAAAADSTYVTSYALRNRCFRAAGFGWTWETSNNTNMMALDTYYGNLEVAGAVVSGGYFYGASMSPLYYSAFGNYSKLWTFTPSGGAVVAVHDSGGYFLAPTRCTAATVTVGIYSFISGGSGSDTANVQFALFNIGGGVLNNGLSHSYKMSGRNFWENGVLVNTFTGLVAGTKYYLGIRVDPETDANDPYQIYIVGGGVMFYN